MLILSKILIALALAGLLRCSGRFRRMGRELDEQVLTAIKKIMHVTEEHGYPPQIIPLLLLLTALSFILSAYVTVPAGR